MVLDTLRLIATPNKEPTWSGTIKSPKVSLGVGAFQQVVPIRTKTGLDSVVLQLYVLESSMEDEDTLALSGIPLNVYDIYTPESPTVIAGCKGLVDEYVAASEISGSYEVLVAETLGEVVSYLFQGTRWAVSIRDSFLRAMPVVTELSPALALNGSKLDKLKTILGLFTPSNLWGQSLTFFVNFFSEVIHVVPPRGGQVEPMVADVSNVRPYHLRVSSKPVTVPAKLVIQESESALFRSSQHLEGYKFREEGYSHKTDVYIDEDDGDKVTISAESQGNRILVGDLVLKDVGRVKTTEVTRKAILMPWGSFENPANIEVLQLWPVSTSLDVSVETSYTYLLGPPYDTSVAKNAGVMGVNKCFPSSKPGTRQQLTRDQGPQIMDEDHHPDWLLSSDGIRVIKKTTVTKELKTSGTTEPVTGLNTPYPAVVESENVTLVEGVYSYDEDGTLVMDRVTSTASTTTGAYTETVRSRVISPISGDLFSETSYTSKKTYDSSGGLIDDSLTDNDTRVLTGKPSGPAPVSAYTSAQTAICLRNVVLRTYSSRVLKAEGFEFAVKQNPLGVMYTGVENLTVEEVKEYLEEFYDLAPLETLVVSFQTDFIDVRGVLSGQLLMTCDSVLQRPEYTDLEGDLGFSTYESGFFEAIQRKPFRVTGVTMAWSDGKPADIAIALCGIIGEDD